MPNDYFSPFLPLILTIYILCVVIGGAVGARAAHGPAGRGALAAFIAVVLQVVISSRLQLDMEDIFLHYGIFVLLLVFVGGWLWLELTIAQLACVAIGSFLLPAMILGLQSQGAFAF